MAAAETGLNQRAPTTNNAALDFSGLFSPPEQVTDSPAIQPLTAEEYKTLTEQRGRTEGHTDPLEREQARGLYIQAARDREDRKRAAEVYRTYQENIKASEQLQTDILKGLTAGENIYSLFLKAIKTIALMTSNTMFYSVVKRELTAVYGRGFQRKHPLQIDVQDTQERLRLLLEAEKAETDSDSRERIRKAITAHEAEINRLKDIKCREW